MPCFVPALAWTIIDQCQCCSPLGWTIAPTGTSSHKTIQKPSSFACGWRRRVSVIWSVVVGPEVPPHLSFQHSLGERHKLVVVRCVPRLEFKLVNALRSGRALLSELIMMGGRIGVITAAARGL